MHKSQESLPGQELIEEGLQELATGCHSSLTALLVLIGAPRLRRLGVSVPFGEGFPVHPEHALYQQIQREYPQDAHSRYNALIRRLVSYERALEQVSTRSVGRV